MGRGKSGRKRKDGNRTKTGRLSRAGMKPGETFSGQPSPWVKAQRDRFGVHYCWAMGRAYASGLLGDAGDGLNRYQAAKRFVTLYKRFYGGSAYTCPLDQSPRGGGHVDMTVSESQEASKQWLSAAIDAMDVAGVRPYFDQLITICNIDRGPAWLDTMIATIDWNAGLPAMNADLRSRGEPTFLPRSQHSGDLQTLAAAIQALDIIAPEQKAMGIISKQWA